LSRLHTRRNVDWQTPTPPKKWLTNQGNNLVERHRVFDVTVSGPVHAELRIKLSQSRVGFCSKKLASWTLQFWIVIVNSLLSARFWKFRLFRHICNFYQNINNIFFMKNILCFYFSTTVLFLNASYLYLLKLNKGKSFYTLLSPFNMNRMKIFNLFL